MSTITAHRTSTETATRSGDALVAALYRAHRRRILAYCLSQLRDRQEADDAVQSTFVYALALVRRGDVPRSELPWLYTIAHNVCRTRRRALKRRGNVESAADLDALHERVGRTDPPGEDALGLISALSTLPPTQRTAFLMREWRGFSYTEVALALGLSESAVEALLFRARRSLAKTLQRATGVAASFATLPVLLRRARNLMPLTNTAKAAAVVALGTAVVGTAIPPLTSPLHQVKPAAPTLASPTTPSGLRSNFASSPTTQRRQGSASDVSPRARLAVRIPAPASPVISRPPLPNARAAAGEPAPATTNAAPSVSVVTTVERAIPPPPTMDDVGKVVATVTTSVPTATVPDPSQIVQTIADAQSPPSTSTVTKLLP